MPAFHLLPIDINSEPGFGRAVNESLVVNAEDVRCTHIPAANRSMMNGKLEEGAVLDRQDHVEIGHLVHRSAVSVWLPIHSEALAQVSHFEHFSNAALDATERPQVRHRASANVLGVLILMEQLNG